MARDLADLSRCNGIGLGTCPECLRYIAPYNGRPPLIPQRGVNKCASFIDPAELDDDDDE